MLHAKRLFQSTPPIRVATTRTCRPGACWIFQSTPPIRVATLFSASAVSWRLDFNPRHPYGWRLGIGHVPACRYRISIHATHTGGDLDFPDGWTETRQFQSTPPIRVATIGCCKPVCFTGISIHATHTGGDATLDSGNRYNLHISIHATHTGGDVSKMAFVYTFTNFNPRHPYGWRRYKMQSRMQTSNISIHATHTGGDFYRRQSNLPQGISIHATHTGGDAQEIGCSASSVHFNPRHPYGWRPCLTSPISSSTTHFNPRHPYGWRLDDSIITDLSARFQSTPPIRVATFFHFFFQCFNNISIHATHTGGDCI